MVKVIFVFLGFFGGRVWTVESKRGCISQILTVWGCGGGELVLFCEKKTTKLNQNLVFFYAIFSKIIFRFNKIKKRVEICVNEG